MPPRDVVVIGAGPAGLCAAAELGRRGIAAEVLERAPALAASWRERYDRLRLNSSRWFSMLPGARYPRGTGAFPTRDEVIGYLERYAAGRGLRIRTGVDVRRIDRDPEGGGWLLRTSDGDVPAAHVVVASGYDGEQLLPEWPGRERFRGTLIHAAAYRNPEPFRDRRVIVVGAGCTAMEIAYDLAEGGADRVWLSIRTPPNIILRTPPGVGLARLFQRLPTGVADRVMRVVRAHDIGDLAPYGLPVPEEGLFARLERLGVAPAIVDRELLDAIRSRRILVIREIDSLGDDGATLVDGTYAAADAIIAATGYRPGLEGLVGHLDVLDGQGAPRTLREPVLPGLHFVGFEPIPGMLGHFGAEARRTAEAIANDPRPLPDTAQAGVPVLTAA
jgi:cation diffusion facilitator CzcD-associated flavoprotein CzcO